jgi:cytochrome c biogenesis protein CcdA
VGERIAAAFAAGLVSIAFPCVLPLVPGYLSAITAVEVDRLGERGIARRVVAASIPFALGFTVVFVVLGAGAAALGGWVDQETRTKIAGFVLVVLGLAFMGLLPWPERMLAPGVAQAGHVQQDVLQVSLARIIGDDEAIALPGVEPLYTPTDPHGLSRRIRLLEFQTRHLPLGP